VRVTNYVEPTDDLGHKELAKRTVSLDQAKREIDTLLQKYVGWADWDGQERAKLYESKMAEFRGGRTSSPS